MRSVVFTLMLLISGSLFADSQATGSELIRSKFNLISHENKAVSAEDFHGRYLMVFFGFSHCPKICPAGLSTLVAVTNKLSTPEIEVVPVFISIDPERDTVERLSNYVKLFDPKLIGLTGSVEEVEATAKSFRAYYGKSRVDKDGNYSYDHSSVIYMIGKQGEYLAHYSSSEGVDQIVAKAREYIK